MSDMYTWEGPQEVFDALVRDAMLWRKSALAELAHIEQTGELPLAASESRAPTHVTRVELTRAIRGFLDGSEVAVDDMEFDWHLDPQERTMLASGLADCLIDLGYAASDARVREAAPLREALERIVAVCAPERNAAFCNLLRTEVLALACAALDTNRAAPAAPPETK